MYIPSTTSGMLNAHEIIPGLWQGAAPPEGSRLRDLGFSALVLCAKEHQPKARVFPGVQTFHAPNDDDFSRPPTRDELRIALNAARQVAQIVRRRDTVLVTCWMGLNRSGLVSALALHLLTGHSGFTCIQDVRRARKRALRNPGFLEALLRLEPKSSLQAYASEPSLSPSTT